eukprot:543297-Rhodomonas_salina.1
MLGGGCGVSGVDAEQGGLEEKAHETISGEVHASLACRHDVVDRVWRTHGCNCGPAARPRALATYTSARLPQLASRSRSLLQSRSRGISSSRTNGPSTGARARPTFPG